MTKRSTVLAWSALAAAFLALAVAEQDRPWKRLQAEHREEELQRLRAELDAERERTSGVRQELRIELEAARQRFEKNRDAARRLEELLEEELLRRRWAANELERLRALAAAGHASEEEVRDARRLLEDDQRTVTDLETELAQLRSEVDALEDRHTREGERMEGLRTEIERLERGALFRRIPVLRGLDPTLTVVEVRPPGLFRETPAGRVESVDRCMSCHPAADHPGDLVGEDGPHRPRLFGCVACHGGDGRATDFARAGHWPGSAAHAPPRRPILPPAFVESACVECHAGDPGPVPGRRASIALGRRLILAMGCTGCHAIDRPSFGDPAGGERPKHGPPLGRLASKTTPEWTFHWIAAPRRFRPTTWMPHLVAGDADGARKTAVIHAMVRFLWSLPGSVESEPPAVGDAEAGAALFASTGCAGCHLIDATATRASVPLERLHGPNLARTGNKVRAGWLYAWLRDPRSHRPDTPMPDLRLSEEEAADLTAFLMASREAAWEDLEMPLIDGATRDALVLEHLEEELTLAESAARLAAMSREDKELYLGKRSLEAYGCHACHEVPGLEGAGEVAGSLASIGDDPRRLLAEDDVLGAVHRRLPGGRSATGFYSLSRRESDAVKAALLSFRAPATAPERRADRGERALVLEKGRRLVEHHGCLGCHSIGLEGGAISTTIPDGRPLPPTLTSAGARFKPAWLLDYLEDPAGYARRPWLAVRMPSFDLGPEEASWLVRYLAERDREPLLTAPPPAPSARDLDAGEVIYAMLRCRGCHAGFRDADEISPFELAPAYRGARDRLRPDWVVEWILDPETLIPSTQMPVTFEADEEAPDSSFLTATISAPMFSDHRQRLLPLFDSESEMLAFLADERRVSVAIRDYLWSLDE